MWDRSPQVCAPAVKVAPSARLTNSYEEMKRRSLIRWQHRLNRERPTCTERNFAPRECGWKHGDSGYSAGKKQCLTKPRPNRLDSDRPSHGRRYHKCAPSIRIFGVNECYGDITPAAETLALT